MLDSLFNHIFLKCWAGKKKAGPNKEILITRKFDTFGDMVYDITWSLKYIHDNGQVSHSINISERANKWDLRRTIKKIEKNMIPDKITELIEVHKS